MRAPQQCASQQPVVEPAREPFEPIWPLLCEQEGCEGFVEFRVRQGFATWYCCRGCRVKLGLLPKKDVDQLRRPTPTGA